MLFTLINIVLSPLNLLFFVLFASTNSNNERYFTSVGTNVSRLKIVPYLYYNLAFTGAILVTTFLASLIFPENINLWEVYQPRYLWLSAVGWAVTGLTLNTYFKGMEGNIMGFIFFPMLLISSLALVTVNIASLFSFSIQIDGPVIDFGFWTRLGIHVFMPTYILMFTNSQKQSENRDILFTPLIGSLIMQMMFFGLNWIVVFIFGTQLSFSYFFGEGQSVVYFIPAIGGAFYFLMKLLSDSGYFASNKWKDRLDLSSLVLIIVCMILQIFNYIKLIKACF